ncbi:hypothetical protein [Inquilinus limosus]|uniref:Lipoprotein n=1 Tax=Inquilinus limosus MP06 TaxID=1398085 RepID=A0A0A0D5Y5_9PROT|nr:hypothetical protein [Inquilinus limosus]KGM33514.1 hypothetical protein P409_15385 [Inquilinus limosus MP06]
MTRSWARILWLAVPALVAGQAIAAGAPPRATGPMTFVSASNGGNCIGCEWTAAEGTITAATPAAFDAYVAENGCPTLHFDSPGGDPAAAMALGRKIREHCVDVEVGRTVPYEDPTLPTDSPKVEDTASGRCEGACVLAFLGGRSRTVEAGELASGGVPESLRPQVASYLSDMGLEPTAVSYLAELMSRPNPSWVGMLEQLGIANAGTETRTLWRDQTEGQGMVATMTRHTPTNDPGETLTLFCRRGDQTPAYLAYSGFDTGTELPDTATLQIGDGAAAASRDVTGPDLESRDGPDGPEVTVALSQAERDAILAGQPFSLSMDALPTVAPGGIVGLDSTLTEADRKAVQQALAHCL